MSIDCSQFNMILCIFFVDLQEINSDMFSDCLQYARNMPWVCAGVGLIFAVLIIVADYALAKTPVITVSIMLAVVGKFIFNRVGLFKLLS